LASVPINLVAIEGRGFLEGQGAQMVTGSLTEGLAFLGSVNPCNANLVLLLRRIQDRKGVAISDAHNLPLDLVRKGNGSE
jgi:hypothetical protein